MRVLVSGATGALGIPLVNYLLSQGDQVAALVRLRKGRSALALRTQYAQGSLGFVYGNVTDDACGLSREELQAHAGAFDVMIHAAGETTYHETNRERTFQVNIEGTRNAMTLATDLQIPKFVFISTAYVAGSALHLSEDEGGVRDNAHNPYEESKLIAERLVEAFPGDSLTLRLSTVIGHSATGSIPSAGGYAGFVKGFYTYRPRIIRYPNNPFFVDLNPASTLNLIPNDWIVEHIRKAAGSHLTGTLHLTHPTPVKMDWLFERTFKGKWLSMPLTYDQTEARKTALYTADATWTATQKALDAIARYFGPYISRDIVFGHERVMLIPGYRPPPMVDDDMIDKQMQFMVQQLFAPAQKLALAAE